MSGGFMLENIIMNLVRDTTKQKMNLVKMFFSKRKDDNIYLYQGSIKDYSWKKIIDENKNTLCTNHFIEKIKLCNYLGGQFSLMFDEADLKNRANHSINDIRNFINEHILQCYNVNQYNITEELYYISCITPT